MNSYTKFLKHLDSLSEQVVKPGLERVEKACELIGHPERDFKSIHIAGTNGKGSTAAFLESIIRNNGYRVGLYTSPHLIDVRERIQIDRKLISEDEMGKLFDRLSSLRAKAKPCLPAGKESSADNLSYFELLTLLAFIYFSEQKVDFAIFETGLGGRWDATNVIQPLIVLLTPIDVDHANYLGSNLLAIAREKCGIIKGKDITPPVITANQRPEVLSLIEQKCSEVGSSLITVRPPSGVLNPSLKGAHQAENAALAVTSAEELNKLGYEMKFHNDYLDVDWPGRLQTISKNPEILVDGAHNPHGCRALAKYVRENYGGRNVVVVFGAMKDKDIREMVIPLKEIASRWIVCPVDNSRAATSPEIRDALGDQNAEVATGIKDAVDKSLRFGLANPLILITGSLYHKYGHLSLHSTVAVVMVTQPPHGPGSQ